MDTLSTHVKLIPRRFRKSDRVLPPLRTHSKSLFDQKEGQEMLIFHSNTGMPAIRLHLQNPSLQPSRASLGADFGDALLQRNVASKTRSSKFIQSTLPSVNRLQCMAQGSNPCRHNFVELLSNKKLKRGP